MLFVGPLAQDCRTVGYRACLKLRDDDRLHVASKPKNALFLSITRFSPHSQGIVPRKNRWRDGGFVS